MHQDVEVTINAETIMSVPRTRFGIYYMSIIDCPIHHISHEKKVLILLVTNIDIDNIMGHFIDLCVGVN